MNIVKRLLNFCAITVMMALSIASISTVVEATISETFDEVDGAVDIAIMRCGELKNIESRSDYHECFRKELRLLMVASHRKDVGEKSAESNRCFVPISQADRLITGDDNLFELCREHVRPLRPCPLNSKTFWSDCVGNYTFTKANTPRGTLIGRYSGEWRLNRRHGEGVLNSPNGERYEGRFFLGVLHGNGKLTFADGTDYHGDFNDGRRTGIASQSYKSGDKFSGTFDRGKRHGVGLLTYADGRVYKGQFKNDELHGMGKLVLTNGDYYEGQFSANSITGDGTLTFSDGRRYVGGWKDNLRHGKGVLYGVDGTVLLEGEWRDGEYVGVVRK